MFDIIKSIKFRKVRSKCQEDLNRDMSEIRKSRNMSFVDKANNTYETKSETIKNLILKNITKTYQKLFNPRKTELGKISKKIIEDINKQLTEKMKMNQWKSTKNVTDWFIKIENKKDCTFIQFDLKEFSTAISESILGRAINFKKEFIDIESSN